MVVALGDGRVGRSSQQFPASLELRHALRVNPVSIPTLTFYEKRLISEEHASLSSCRFPHPRLKRAYRERGRRLDSDSRRTSCGPLSDSDRPLAGTVATVCAQSGGSGGRRREPFPWFQRSCASSRSPHHFCCTSNESLRRINKGCRALRNRGPSER